MKEALFYSVLKNQNVKCNLCPHNCTLKNMQKGICLARQNINGKLISLSYQKPVTFAIDPIEKKPLYHFKPGSYIFSTGPNGCTFKCDFCQNYEISQYELNTSEIDVNTILNKVINSDTIGIAYTYSEPWIWYETIYELAPRIKDSGMYNVMITNGYMNIPPLKEIINYIDAFNVDIKSMSEEFYKKHCKASLKLVLESAEFIKKHSHLEITYLMITDENDSDYEIEKLAKFIKEKLGKDTPLHISRYFPRYKLQNPPTPMQKLFKGYEIAKNFLDYVYLGNIFTDKTNTLCPTCKTILIDRTEYSGKLTKNSIIKNNKLFCINCNTEISIIL